MSSTHLRGVGDQTPVTGGVSLPAHLIAMDAVSGTAPDDDLGRRAFWLLTLHSKALPAELKSADLSAMNDDAKRQLIADIQGVLEIEAFKSDVL